jgi:hypothetical protein
LLEGIRLNFSLKNEFGTGVYLTDDLSLARDYAGIRNGSILVFNWSDDKGLLTKTLSGEEWENTVKGWICMGGSKPLPPIHEEEDMLIGAVTNNYSAILHCSKVEVAKVACYPFWPAIISPLTNSLCTQNCYCWGYLVLHMAGCKWLASLKSIC